MLCRYLDKVLAHEGDAESLSLLYEKFPELLPLDGHSWNLVFSLGRHGWAAVEILESSVLRLESTTSPYSYRVIEKSTGEVLLVQDNTSFIIGDEAYPVAEATNVVEDADGIHGNLIVETAGREQLPDGAPERGQVSFTFLRPERLQIHITYNNASPSEAVR